MIRRLILVLQSISLIPPIGMFIYTLIDIYIRYSFEDTYQYEPRYSDRLTLLGSFFLLSFIPFILLILGKYIVYGKFYIFKEKVEEQ
jgi:hypothetical protein